MLCSPRVTYFATAEKRLEENDTLILYLPVSSVHHRSGILPRVECLNGRPVSYYSPRHQSLSQSGLLGGLSMRQRRLLKLELRGDVPALSMSGHAPQACKNNHKVSATSYIPPRSKNRGSAKVHFLANCAPKVQ